MSQVDKGQLWKTISSETISSDRVVEIARVHGCNVAYTWIEDEFNILQIGMITLTQFYKFYEEYEADK